MHKWLALFLLVLAGGHLWLGWYIPAKAQVAQWLLQRSWHQTQEQQRPIPPWPWADSWPVARLQIPSLDVDLIILDGDSGAALAFAPGLRRIDTPEKSIMISAHRDTHFQFMQQLQYQKTIKLTHHDGRQQHFRVLEKKVVDSRKALQLAATNAPLLLLVTCYPFDAIQPGGPLRFIVVAEKMFVPPLPTMTAYAD